LFRNRRWTRNGICRKCPEYTFCQGNGLHNRLNNNATVICHFNKLKYAEKL
jgi:hypothetical protein